MKTTKQQPKLDWLAETALQAISQASPDLASWCEDRRPKLASKDRLGVLGFIAFDLDSGNQEIVAGALGFPVQDLAAVRRVLQKI